MSADHLGPCIDAETLAAWREGGLTRAQAATVETHLSSCPRCQAMAAVLVRSDVPPVPAGAAVPFWRRWHLQWLVPLTAAATVAAIWVGVPTREYTAPPADELAGRTSPAEHELSKAVAPPAAQPTATTPAPVAAELPSALAEQRTVPAPAERDADKKVASVPAAPAFAQPAAPPPAVDALADATPVPGGARAAGAGLEAGASRERKDQVAAPAPVASAMGRLGQTANDAARERANAVSALEVPSPDGRHRWRVGADARLESSDDGGETWMPIGQPLPGPLVAGASPAAAVCWLVGADGLVLVSGDGQIFNRATPPARVALTSVTATSALAAIVTTADGRRFETRDAGRSWEAR